MIEFMAGWFARGASDATAEAIERKVKEALRAAKNLPTLEEFVEEFGEAIERRMHTVRTGGADVVWSDGRSYVMRNGDSNLEPGANQAYEQWREEQDDE